MITKELLEQRIIALEQARDQLLANANTTNGSLLEARYWLLELNKAPEVIAGDG